MDADVLVIGAGAAGLAAASALRRADFRPLVLEARDRVGGRVWTRRPPDAPWPVRGVLCLLMIAGRLEILPLAVLMAALVGAHRAEAELERDVEDD